MTSCSVLASCLVFCGEKQIPRFARNDKLFNSGTLDANQGPGSMRKTAQAEACATFESRRLLATSFSRVVNEMRGEMENAFKSLHGHVVVGLGFADFGG